MKKMKKTIITIIFALSLVLFMASHASASGISTFDAEYDISGDQTSTVYTLGFEMQEYETNNSNDTNSNDTNSNDTKTNNTFSIDIPADADVMVRLDGNLIPHSEARKDTKKTISFQYSESAIAVIEFTTGSYVDTGSKNYFVADIKSDYPIDSLKARVRLPDNSFLLESKKEGGSVFPNADITTDGKNIFIEWAAEELEPKSSFPMFIIYKTVKGWNIITYIIAFLVISAAAYLAIPYFIKRQIKTAENMMLVKKDALIESPKKESKENANGEDKEGKTDKSEELRRILSHLTEDEQQIVNILADREGHIEQGTLVIITGFSKAHLSRLLDELQRRRIVHKEKKGKKNIVWLKSQF